MHNAHNATATAALSAPPPRFKGQPVDLGGVTYIVPPLALGALRDGLLEQLGGLRIPESGLPDKQTIDTMLAVMGAAIRRNYPDMSDEQLAELVDLGNLGELFSTVVAKSGLKPRGLEGNARPRPDAPSTGG